MAIINLYETEEIKCAQTAQRCVSLKGSGRGRAARGSLQRIWGWGWGPGLGLGSEAEHGSRSTTTPPRQPNVRSCAPGLDPRRSRWGCTPHPARPAGCCAHAVRGGWCEPAPGGLNPAASQQAAPEDCEELRLSPAPKESEQ